MANPKRGEIETVIDGKPRLLRPTFNALCEIEDKLGCSLLSILQRMQEDPGAITLRVMAVIIWGGMRGADSDDAMTVEEIGECMLAEGIDKATRDVVRFVHLAFSGPVSGNAPAP